MYCGRVGKVTRDHIPPECLFPIPRPKLITVPSCRSCNEGASKDDEYFRLTVALRDDVWDNPSVQNILPSVMRSLKNPKKMAFRRSFLRGIHEENIRSPAGLHLGKRGAYDVDLKRLDRVSARIVKGLYYREYGHRLPDGFVVVAYSEDGLRDLDEPTLAHLRTSLLEPLLANPPSEIGRQIFEYRKADCPESPGISAWLLTFYEKVSFVAWTMPLDECATA